MNEQSLDWLALQYVLDELSDSERQAFEERMEQDLAACEAVGRMTRLELGLQQVFETTDAPVLIHRDSARLFHRSSLAVAAACTMLACLMFTVLSNSHRPTDIQIVQHQTPAGLTSNLPASENIAILSIWGSSMTGLESEADEPDEEWQDLMAPDALPLWLLAGVSLEVNAAEPAAPQNRKDN